MSYCRWSSIGGQCDLYVYADVSGGVTIHIASYRRVLTDDVPKDPTPDMINEVISPEEWSRLWKERNAILNACELRPIGLSRDGQSFNLDFDEAADLIADLRAEGYLMPDGLEDEVREDARSETDDE